MTLGELFEETYIQGEIAIRSYDSTGLCAHPIPVSSVFQTGQKGLLTCTRF